MAASHRGPGVIAPAPAPKPLPHYVPPPEALPPPPPPPPPRAQVQAEQDWNSLPQQWVDQAERERQEHVQAERGRNIGAYRRSTTVSAAKAGQLVAEEAVRRQYREDRAGRDQLAAARSIVKYRPAATAFEPVPAYLRGKDPAIYKTIAKMPPGLAAELPPKPKRLPPLVLSSPHEAAQPFHEDWTLVKNSWKDPAAREKEYKLRDDRNRMIWEKLVQGGPAFYPSSGNSMWPMLQSHDHCLFHPIQAVRMGPASPPPHHRQGRVHH